MNPDNYQDVIKRKMLMAHKKKKRNEIAANNIQLGERISTTYIRKHGNKISVTAGRGTKTVIFLTFFCI